MVELKVPKPLLVNVTVPVGVILLPEDASATVAVQVEGAFTGSEPGVQTTLTEDERFETMRLKVPEVVRWFVSPP